MYPNIPEDLSALSVAELKALRSAIRAWALSLPTDGSLSADDAALVRKAATDRQALAAEIEEKTATAAALAEALADEPEDDDDEEADDEDEVVADEVVEEDEEPVEVAAADETETEEVEEKELETVAASAPAVKTGLGARKAAAAVAPKPLITHLQAADRVGGKNPGDQFDSWNELAEVLAEVGRQAAGSAQRFNVAKIVTEYPADRILSDDTRDNLQLFEPEVMAAMCAPCTPNYDVSARTNSTRRPVFASLPNFQAPRGCASFYPSPSLSDITGGYGLWTQTEENNPAAEKVDCQEIECATPEEFFIYGAYRCLTVRNMLAITYPELVQAYLNRLEAAWARMAEKQLLNAMGAEATSLDVAQYAYNARTSLTSALLTYLALYSEIERWDAPSMHVWLHRWVLTALKMDQVRQRRTDGGVTRIPSDAEITRIFSDAGFEVTWVLDQPTWMTAVPPISAGGELNQLPNTIDMLVAPTGKFGLMDKGELRIGVAPGNIYRDNASNKRNEFTYFYESFEGIVDTDNRPAHILSLPVCFTGQQVADFSIGAACDGLLESVS